MDYKYAAAVAAPAAAPAAAPFLIPEQALAVDPRLTVWPSRLARLLSRLVLNNRDERDETRLAQSREI